MIIRKAKEEDYNGIDELVNQLLELHLVNRPDMYVKLKHPLSLDEFNNFISSNRKIVLVAEDDSKLIGFGIVTIMNNSGMVKNRKVALLDNIYVVKEQRGKGVGSNLLSNLRNLSKDKGAKRMDLVVWSFNTKAIEFYKKNGMAIQRYILEDNINN